MRSRGQRTIYFILVWFMIAAGMCPDDVLADSSYLRTPVKQVCLSDMEAEEDPICSAEIIPEYVRNFLLQMDGRCIRKVRLTFWLLDRDCSAENPEKEFRDLMPVLPGHLRSEELVADYLHKSDGKKKI